MLLENLRWKLPEFPESRHESNQCDPSILGFKILSGPVRGILVGKAFPLTKEANYPVPAPFMADNLLNLQIEVLFCLYNLCLTTLAIRKQLQVRIRIFLDAYKLFDNFTTRSNLKYESIDTACFRLDSIFFCGFFLMCTHLNSAQRRDA